MNRVLGNMNLRLRLGDENKCSVIAMQSLTEAAFDPLTDPGIALGVEVFWQPRGSRVDRRVPGLTGVGAGSVRAWSQCSHSPCVSLLDALARLTPPQPVTAIVSAHWRLG